MPLSTSPFRLLNDQSLTVFVSATLPTVEGGIITDSGQQKHYAFTNGIGGWFPKMIYSNSGSKTQSGVVTAQSIVPTDFKGTVTLPANYFKVGKRLRFIMRGVYTTDAAAGNVTITFKLGSTVWRTTGSFAPDNSVTNGYWRMEGAIACRTTGVTGTVGGTTTWKNESTTGGNTPLNSEKMNSYADVTLNTTISQVFDVQWTADDAGTSITTNDMVMWEEC